MEYSARDLEVLFDTFTEVPDSRMLNGVKLTRTQTTRAGSHLYVRCYPVWNNKGIAGEARKARKNVSRSVAERINHRESLLKLEQIINANFGDGDMFLTLTYSDETQPSDDRQCKKDISLFLIRLKRYMSKKGEALKYAYCHETTESKRRGVRHHVHLIFNGRKADRDEVENLWNKGHVNSKRCKTDKAGLAGIANYMGKDYRKQTKHGRSWVTSRNCARPVSTTANHKVSVRQELRIAQAAEEYGRPFFERKYPGYEVTDDVIVKTSAYVSGAYIYVRLKRRGASEFTGVQKAGEADGHGGGGD